MKIKEDLDTIAKMLINGNCTKEEIAKKYGIDHRTLDKELSTLKNKNPILFLELSSKFPYKPNKNDHLNYKAMIIEMMKTGDSKINIAKKYGITTRSLSMKIKELEKSNPELIDLYRCYAQWHSRKLKLTVQEIEKMNIKIEDLPDLKVSDYETAKEKKIRELEELKINYYKLKESGKTQKEIEDGLGMAYSAIIRNIEQLKRINVENNRGI